jgi:hypothetical protein
VAFQCKKPAAIGTNYPGFRCADLGDRLGALSRSLSAIIITPPMHLAGVPIVASDPTWPVDYNIVPRCRYRPQDDRVDTSPNAPPVAPGDIQPGGPGPSGW